MRDKRLTIIVISTAAVTFFATVALCVLTPFLSLFGAFPGKLGRINEIIERYYIDDYDRNELVDGAAWGMVSALGDPYSVYLDEEMLYGYKQLAEGNYDGIGVEVFIDSGDNLMTVSIPFEGTPCERAGILPGDKIIQVDDMPVNGDNFAEAVQYLRGQSEEGKKVSEMTLKILRKGSEPFTVTVKREKIEIKTVASKRYGDVEYIRISGFDSNTARDFESALGKIDTETTRGIVLDLRDNPGGLYIAAVDVCDLLLDEGLIVYTEDKSGKQEKMYSDGEAFELPLVLLINENSASASEIVAGAIKDRGRGTIVGKKSFGKGVVQEIKSLHDGTAVKITTSRYFSPSGKCIDKLGIEPDIEVDLGEGAAGKKAARLEFEEDTQLQKAIEVLKAR